MQTSRDNVQLAGAQVPLLDEAQLLPGVLLTGVAMNHVWEVLDIDRRTLFIRKLPADRIPCRDHTFAAYGRGQVCSICAVRSQAISEFMPKRENKARVHVITPRTALITPMPYTVYGYLLPNGTAETLHVSGTTWDKPVPIVPSLSILWTIPEDLRALVPGAFNAAVDPVPQF